MGFSSFFNDLMTDAVAESLDFLSDFRSVVMVLVALGVVAVIFEIIRKWRS